MEAAWQYLKKPKDEQKLAHLKLDMIRRLLKRNIPKNRIKAIIGFIALYVDFDNLEIKTKFEQEMKVITNTTQPMGFEQMIQEEFKKQGLEQGLEQGIVQGIEQGIVQGIEIAKDELLHQAVPELLQEGFKAERIAAILSMPLESVQAVIDQVETRFIASTSAESASGDEQKDN
jgi:predicted transposase YdaD